MKILKYLLIGPGLLALSSILLNYLFYDEKILCLVQEEVENMKFDFIIVGSGTSGSVLAYELTKNTNYSVLLIEAGGIFGALASVPMLSPVLQLSSVDYSFKTQPQKFSSKGFKGQQQRIPRGKGLGGSHQLNFMLHFKGLDTDFDEWEAQGATDWSYKNLKNILNHHDCEEFSNFCEKTTEINCACNDNTGFTSNSPKLHIMRLQRNESPLGDAFLRAGEEISTNNDFDVNFDLPQLTIKNGKRHSVYHEFLKRSFQHENLKILINAQVLKIEFNGKRASTVLVSRNQKVFRVHVKKEIILAAGAIHSPYILQLSGIGDGLELKAAGIGLIHNLPAVGQNLFDQMNFPLFVSINKTWSINKDKLLSIGEIYKYLMHGRGHFATTGIVGVGRKDDYGVILFAMGSADEKALKELGNYNTETFRAIFPLYKNSSQEGFIFLSTCLKTKSRGTLKLNATNIYSSPLIDINYLSENEDIICMQKAVQLLIETIKTKSFQEIGAKIHWPQIKECSNFGPFPGEPKSSKYLECIIRMGATTAHHPGGTCAIGKVLDNELKVKGVSGLRVIDGSVFPSPLSGVPNSITIAIAQKASQLIKVQN